MTPEERLKILKPFFYALRGEIIKLSEQSRKKICLGLDTLADSYGFIIDWKHGPGLEVTIKTHLTDPAAVLKCMVRVEMLKIINNSEIELLEAIDG